MVPPAPHPGFQLTVSTISNQSLLRAVSVSQETGFCVRRQRARKHTVVVRPSLWRPKRGNEARQTWAMRESPGNLLKRRSAWWWMQSRSNLSLPAFGEMQGDFDEMQGEPIQFLAESHCAVRSCNEFSLSKEQGGASGFAGKSRVARYRDQELSPGSALRS